jgi:hypothetical protein
MREEPMQFEGPSSQRVTTRRLSRGSAAQAGRGELPWGWEDPIVDWSRRVFRADGRLPRASLGWDTCGRRGPSRLSVGGLGFLGGPVTPARALSGVGVAPAPFGEGATRSAG